MLRLAKGVLAARLSLRAETLSRILKQLADDDIASASGRNIVRIHSADRLRALALETVPPPAWCRNERNRHRVSHG